MSRVALTEALKAVPFLDHLAIVVDDARPGNVGLRLPATPHNLDHDGNLAHGALFQVAETAAALAVGTHATLRGMPHSHRVSHVQYRAEATKDVTARCSVPRDAADTVADQLRDHGEATLELRVEILDGWGRDVCLMTSVFGFSSS